MDGGREQGGGGSDHGSDDGQFTEQYAAFLAEHKQNKARLKAETSKFVDETSEVARGAYLDKLQNVDEQLQALQSQKEEVVAAKSRHQQSSLSRDELPNLDDLEKELHTILRMKKRAADSIAEMQTEASPSQTKMAKGEELIGNLDSILAKRALLVDKISSFAVHMAGHDSLQMTPGFHAELDEIYQRKRELAADMRSFSGSSVADLQNRLTDVYKRKEEVLTGMHGEDEGESEEKLVWKRTEYPTKPAKPAEPKKQQEPEAEAQRSGQQTGTDEAQEEDEAAEKLVWKRTEYPTKPTNPAQPKRFQPLMEKDSVASQLLAQDPVQNPAKATAELPSKGFQPLVDKEKLPNLLSSSEGPAAAETEEKLVWKRTEFPTKKSEQQPVKGAGEGKEEPAGGKMKVIQEATAAPPPTPKVDPLALPEGSKDAGIDKEKADAVLFAEISRLIELLKKQENEENINPEGSTEPSSAGDVTRVDEILSSGEAMRQKLDDLQKIVDDVAKSGKAPTSSSQTPASMSKLFDEKREEVTKIEEFAGLCKKSRLPDPQAFLPIVQAKMYDLKADISVLETQTTEMQTAIQDTGIAQPAVAPEAVAMAATASEVQVTVNEARDLPQPSLISAKLRVREALNNVAYSAIAFCAFGLAVFVLGIFAPVGFPCWGPAVCLATVGAFYSSTKANGLDTPVYPRLFRNGAVLACFLLLVSAVLFALAFLSILGLRGTPACSSAILYSPECMEPITATNGTAASAANETPCFNDMSLEEYNSRVRDCEALHICYNGKVKLASCDLMVAINGFGALFSVSLAVTVVCVSMWVYAHLETRIREHNILEDRIANNEEVDTENFAPLSTCLCLSFFGCGCCCCCCSHNDVEANGNRLRLINDSGQME